MKSKPNILFIADYPNWAFHNIYRSVSLRLDFLFDFSIYFTSFKKKKSNEKLLQCEYDLVWLCYPSDKTYLKLKVQTKCLIKEVASWRWKNDYFSTQEFVELHLGDANYIACPSKELFTELSKYANNVVYIPNGVENGFFKKEVNSRRASESVKFGWVGNSKDPLKNFHEIKKLQDQGLNVKIAENLNLFKLRAFYQTIDVLLITSQSESQPLPFLEALSSGCSVVSRSVGIVPEFKGFNNVKIVPFENSISDYIINAAFYIHATNKENDILDLNNWNKIINIYKYFFESAVNESVDFNLLNSRYPIVNAIDSEIRIPKLKYKAAVYFDWVKYGNTKI